MAKTLLTVALLKAFAQKLKDETERFQSIKSTMDNQLKSGFLWDDPVAQRFRAQYEEGLQPIEKKLVPAMAKYYQYLNELVMHTEEYADESGNVNFESFAKIGTMVAAGVVGTALILSRYPMQEMYQEMNKQRLITIMNQLKSQNGGEMPEYMGDIGKEYHFKDYKTGAMFFVAKDGSYMEYAENLSGRATLQAEAEVLGHGVGISSEGDIAGSKGNHSIAPGGSSVDYMYTKDFDEKEHDKINDHVYGKGADAAKIEAGVNAKVAGVRTSQIHLNEDGSAWKTEQEVNAFDFDARAKANLKGVGANFALDFVNGEGKLAHISSPQLSNDGGQYVISQSEVSGKIGAGLGASGKWNMSADVKEVEAKLGVKFGAGYQSYDSSDTLKNMSPEITKKVVLDFANDSNSQKIPSPYIYEGHEIIGNYNRAVPVFHKEILEGHEKAMYLLKSGDFNMMKGLKNN